MQKTQILWADDEIDLLKPHILFLNNKGYDFFLIWNFNLILDLFKAESVPILTSYSY